MVRKKSKPTAIKLSTQQKNPPSFQLDELVRDRVREAFADKLRLETFIKNETRAATFKICGLTGVLFGAITIAGFIGWDQILERVATNAAAKVADDVALTTAKTFINDSASILVSNTVPIIIDSSVPQMISDKIVQTERQLKQDMSDYVASQITLLKADEQALVDKYRVLEAKLSYLPYMAEARGGNRKSYDVLRNAATNNPELASFINAAINEVENQYKTKKFFHDRYSVTLKRPDSKKWDDEDYVMIITADNDWNCDGAINDLSASKKKEFVSVYVNAVAHSKRLDSVYLAITAIENATKKSFPAIGVDDVLAWWDTVRESEEYDSAWMSYVKLKNEMIKLGDSIITNRTEFNSIVSQQNSLLMKHPKFVPLARNMLLLIAYSPFRKEIIRAENSPFMNALDACQDTPFGKTDKWYCYKAFYAIFHGQFQEIVANRLKESPSFESEMKICGLFNPGLFDRDVFDWPSKKEQSGAIDANKTESKETTIESTSDATVMPKSSGIVGYVTVHIKQGKQDLRIPFVNDDNFTKEKLESKGAPFAIKGDVISWTIEQDEYQYEFNGEEWIDGNGETANDIEIPIGSCQIFYERTEPIETDMSFSGIVAL